MSALVNTAGQYKVGANMLQAKDISGKGKLTGFHDFFSSTFQILPNNPP